MTGREELTPELILALPPGRILDGFVALHFYGYRWSTVAADAQGENAGELLIAPDHSKHYTYPTKGAIPWYWHARCWSTDLIYAFSLAESMRFRDLAVTLMLLPAKALLYPEGEFSCVARSRLGNDPPCQASASTLPEAIAKLALVIALNSKTE